MLKHHLQSIVTHWFDVSRNARVLTDAARGRRIGAVKKNPMNKPTVARCVVLWLAAGALFLPISICVIAGVGTLLGALGDSSGAVVLGRTALGVSILWTIDLIGLIIALAINSLCGSDNTTEE